MKKVFLSGSTLVEVLIVMIVSGIVFMALFDGMQLVRRYTERLNRTFSFSDSLLEGYRRLDELFQKCDSVKQEGDAYCFYWDNAPQVRIVCRDSVLYCDRDEMRDTLWRSVIRVVPLPLKGEERLIDSLNVFLLHKKTIHCMPLGLSKRISRESERKIREFEEKNNTGI